MSEDELRGTLSRLLRQSYSHVGLTRAVDGFPAALAGTRVEGFRHTAWQLVEHLRLAAEDLVSYCLDADYEKLRWPEGYWPETTEPPTEEAWRESVRRLLDATEAMAALAEDPEHDLFAQVPSAVESHHHTLRAALILLDHNGYHAGQLIDLRLALGIWPPSQSGPEKLSQKRGVRFRPHPRVGCTEPIEGRRLSLRGPSFRESSASEGRRGDRARGDRP